MCYRALITGSSSGIGYQYARHLSKQGWNLDLISQDQKRSLDSKKNLSYENANFHVYDLGKKESINSIIDSFDVPDLIVANAGIAINGVIGELSPNEKEYYYYLMCGGVIDLIEGFVPEMIKKGSGRIVIVSSIGATTAMPKSSLYSSIKAGIHAYGRSISSELINENISVTVSLPGYVRTNAHKRAGLNHLEKKVPNWMWVSPEQVVRETEKASLKGNSEIIPGTVYKLVRPFLNFKPAIRAWRNLTKRS
ncbi:SDR family NAD(P)-dependent oxidoreductase [Gammaproteobacteria bacterium]|nr:SDR family NAD(P)-dependent oxidoreductase [Gammaproteobacteria bacterium]